MPLLMNNNISSIGFHLTFRRGAGKSARGSATRDETCLFIFRVGPLHRNQRRFWALLAAKVPWQSQNIYISSTNPTGQWSLPIMSV